jgi:hypothetical protein
MRKDEAFLMEEELAPRTKMGHDTNMGDDPKWEN